MLVALLPGMKQRQKSRQKRRSRRQAARQKRRQTRTAGRFDPEVVAARQARRGAMVDKFGTIAASVGAGMLGQGDALAAYTGDPDVYVDDFDPAPAPAAGLSTPMMIGIGAAVVALVFVMTKK